MTRAVSEHKSRRARKQRKLRVPNASILARANIARARVTRAHAVNITRAAVTGGAASACATCGGASLLINDPLAADQKAMRVDAVRRACHKRADVGVTLDAQLPDLVGKHRYL